MFKYKQSRKALTENEAKYLDKEVKKLPTILTAIFIIYLIIFVSFSFLYFSFQSTYEISKIIGTSMQPTLNNDIVTDYQADDIVYVNKYKKGKKGDIIIIQTERNSIIKRVVATEGDKVSIFVADDGYYHVSIQYANTDEPIIVEEDYIKSYQEWRYTEQYTNTITLNGVTYEERFYSTFIASENYKEYVYELNGVYYIEVPKDKYFCLGDNRSVSADSRIKGFFDKKNIKGVAEIIVDDGATEAGSGILHKLSAIIGFYWQEIENSLARS